MSFVGFLESKLHVFIHGAGELSPTFSSELQQAVVFFLAELLVKTVAEIQLKICRFSSEPKAIWKFGDSVH